MTHIAHPYAQRLGINRDWRNRWFAATPKQRREYIRTDYAVRTYLGKKLKGMAIDSTQIDRDEKVLRIVIKTAKPGLIIGRGGDGAVTLKKEIDLLLRTLRLTEKPEVKIDIEEVKAIETSATIVAQMVAEGLEKRMQFRRILKQTVEKVMGNRDVKGVRIIVSGRLGGADMARQEELKKGRIPLQTLRADIDFARERANLPYGVIGIKVWIYRGDVFTDRKANKEAEKPAVATRRARAHIA
jgi:small subunit ribosomal protein S3